MKNLFIRSWDNPKQIFLLFNGKIKKHSGKEERTSGFLKKFKLGKRIIFYNDNEQYYLLINKKKIH